MKNWKEYVKVQYVNNIGCDNILYLEVIPSIVLNGFSCNIAVKIKHISDIKEIYTEETICDAVEGVLLEFPNYGIQRTSMDFIRIKNKIALNSKRGRGNCSFKNVHYYLGAINYDSPIIVAECNNEYKIFKHPNFDNYGFRYTSLFNLC